MDRLLIFGNSWSLGTWKHVAENQIKLDDPGMAKVLEESFRVTNFSKSNSSSWELLYTMWNYFDKIAVSGHQSKVIVFQQDAVKSILSEKYDVSYPTIYKQATGLDTFYESLIEIFYIKLNQLAQQFNITVHLVGCSTDLHTGIIDQFSNITPMCVSWIKLLEPDHTPSIIPVMVDRQFLSTAKGYGNLNLCNEIMNHSDNTFPRLMSLLQNKHFDNPNAFGDFHPNLKGHQVLADYIKNYFC